MIEKSLRNSSLLGSYCLCTTSVFSFSFEDIKEKKEREREEKSREGKKEEWKKEREGERKEENISLYAMYSTIVSNTEY